MNASALVRNWHPTVVARPGAVAVEQERALSTLVYPNASYRIAVCFTTIDGMPNAMRVRSTNWRYEDEPNGVFDIREARAFYVDLLRAGFILEQRA